MKADRFLSHAVMTVLIVLGLASSAAKADDLQGQNSDGFGNPQGIWVSGNLQNWKELEYIPCRVVVTGGPISNRLVTVEFPYAAGGNPGIQNLTGFTPSGNVIMTSVPTLNSSTDNWKYTFTVTVTNNQPGTVQFFARMRAGAHLFVGSSLKLSYPPLQIHKPDAGVGIPDLAVKKIGPANAAPGDLITYTIYYTNKVSAAHSANGVQLTDILPSSVTYVPGSASNGGEYIGNNLIWDLPNLAVGASGSVTYQAVVNANVVNGSSFQNSAEILSAEDDSDYADNKSIVTTVVSFNSAPVANPDSYSVNEDGVLNVNAPGILANDTDADSNPLTALLATSTTQGALTLNPSGSFTYSPNADFNGTDSFTYRANDGATNSGVATVTITINPVNDAPVANDDAYSVVEGGTLTRNSTLGVLVNDTDVEASSLTAILVSNPSNGTVTLNNDGSFTYIHNGSETTSDSFTYKANDGVLDSGIATVNLTITPRNDAPVANDDSYTVAEGGTLTRIAANGVLINDSDAESNTLNAVLVSNPSHGTLTLNADGSFSYEHNGSETQVDSFTYKANDGLLDSGIATVTIQITSVNDAPVANNDSYTVAEGGTLNPNAALGVLLNDTDVETNTLTANLVSSPAHGMLTLNADGSFTYIHNGSETTSDSFIYKANDGLLDSAVATVTITITSLNDAPAANNDSYTMTEGGTLNPNAALGVLVNDTDAETNTLTAILVSQPANGTVILNTDGSFTYVHNGSETTSDSFTYKANDGLSDSGIATVDIAITSQNNAPVANNDFYTVAEGGTLNPNVALGVLVNDTDAETNTLTAILVSQPANGTVILNTDGSFTYVHNGSETTSDSFTYKANDGLLDSAVATVTITITSVNDAPVANDDFYEVAEGGTLTRTAVQGILANDTDADTNLLTAILVSGPEKGTLTLNTNNGSFSYVHNGSEGTNDSFTYRAHDGVTNSGIATVRIRVVPVNDAPVANNDSYEVREGALLVRNASAGVLANDTDAEGTGLTARALNGPSHGTLTLNLDGSFSYQHDGSETKSDTFTYAASDGFLTSSATVTIAIVPVNDAPIAINDLYSVAEGGTLNPNGDLGILANDLDAETNLLTALLISSPTKGILTLNTNNGSFTYIHNGSEGTNDSFTYRAYDGFTNSGVATVTIQITPVNDAPVANDDFYTVAEGAILLRTISNGVLLNDTDAETNLLKAILVSSPSNGVLSYLNTNGSFRYVHNGSETTSDSFTYKVNDGSLDSGIATVTIAITSSNDAPIASGDSYAINEDALLTVNAPGVLANDTDEEANLLSAIIVNTTTNGTLTLAADGSLTYLPNTDFNGVDSFTYKANDGAADSIVATVNLVIDSVNDAPSFTAGADQLVIHNSGTRSVAAWATNIKTGPTNEQNQTAAFQLSNDNAALFLQQPAISPDGTLSFAPAFNAFGRANVSVALKDNGGTSNGGVDTSATQILEIIVNSPPTVDIVSPTNGSSFIWGQNVTLISEATDPDGSVTNVQFFEGTNFLGEVPAAPYFQTLTNMQPGIYQFTAIATDDFGLSATSSVITITVLGALPFTEAGLMVLNPQTGLIEQRLLVQNPTPNTLSAARVLVFNLPIGARVYNASGTNASGIPFVQYNQAIPPGATVEMLIEYYVPSRIPPMTTLVMEVVPTIVAAEPLGTNQRIDRGLPFTGGTFLLEFTTVANRFYSIQYSSDLVTWKAAPLIQGNGSKVQWIDNGSPKTESLPANSGQRFYRVILLP